jgi:hypothetical protein
VERVAKSVSGMECLDTLFMFCVLAVAAGYGKPDEMDKEHRQ